MEIGKSVKDSLGMLVRESVETSVWSSVYRSTINLVWFKVIDLLRDLVSASIRNPLIMIYKGYENR